MSTSIRCSKRVYFDYSTFVEVGVSTGSQPPEGHVIHFVNDGYTVPAMVIQRQLGLYSGGG